ncbi:MAG TPA: ACT domain-containing protein [Verrucomicrobiales bacterium]|jgi:glycine cleavage system regulatory protein|nr:ACT domain-containing protein [Verrucomicrobiales bacterium]
MQTSLIVSVIGPDRPGLIEKIASVITAASGNWEGSRMLRLAGQFSGMVQVVIAEDALPELNAALAELEKSNLHIRILHSGGIETTPETGRVMTMEVVGQDRQGIVSSISRTLSQLGVNVIELATDCSEAPWSGERLFKTNARLIVPEDISGDRLREAVEEIALDLMVELKTDPA